MYIQYIKYKIYVYHLVSNRTIEHAYELNPGIYLENIDILRQAEVM